MGAGSRKAEIGWCASKGRLPFAHSRINCISKLQNNITMKRITLAILALSFLGASCGDETPATGTNPGGDTAVLVPNTSTVEPTATIDTMAVGTSGTTSTNANGTTTTTNTTNGTTANGSAATTNSGASATASGTAGHSTGSASAKMDASHQESIPAGGNVKTKTVIKTEDDGSTKTKTKTVTSH